MAYDDADHTVRREFFVHNPNMASKTDTVLMNHSSAALDIITVKVISEADTPIATGGFSMYVNGVVAKSFVVGLADVGDIIIFDIGIDVGPMDSISFGAEGDLLDGNMVLESVLVYRTQE